MSSEEEVTLGSSNEADSSDETSINKNQNMSFVEEYDDLMNLTSKIDKLDLTIDGNEGDNEGSGEDDDDEFDEDDLELLGVNQPVTGNVSVRPSLKAPRKSAIVFISSGEESDGDEVVPKIKRESKKADTPRASLRLRLDSVELLDGSDSDEELPILSSKKKNHVMAIKSDDSDEPMSITPQKPLFKKEKDLMIIKDDDGDEVMSITPQKPLLKKEKDLIIFEDDDNDEVMSISPPKPFLKKEKDLIIFEDDDSDEVMSISPPKPFLKPVPVVPKLPTNAKINLANIKKKVIAAKKPAIKKPAPIINYNKLQKTTRQADKAEKARIKRLEAKQKIFEKTFDKDDPDSKRILDFDLETKKPLVRIHKSFAGILKEHQFEGIKFMYESVVESVERLQREDEDADFGCGCILAHSMGLGKTFQVVAFLHSIMTNRHTQDYIERVLIVVPYNVIENWAQEFDKWIHTCKLDWDVRIFEMRLAKTLKKRIDLLKSWYKRGGILLVTNALFSRTVTSLPTMKDSRDAEAIEKYLLQPGPDLIIIDEGHLLKNESGQLNQSLQLVETKRRVILTGTPLQNNLAEYYTMVDFVKNNLLGTREEFKNKFQTPIEHGQNKDSLPMDVSHMKKRIHVLYQLLKSCIHRCDYNVLLPYLKPKSEYVLSVSMTPKQIDMYKFYLDNFAEKPQGESKVRKNLFRDKNMLSHIWTHPILIHDYHEESVGKENFVNMIGDWYRRFVDPEEDYRLELSSKLTLLFAILEASERIGDKVVIFSQSLLVLNLIEDLLRRRSKETSQKGEQGSRGVSGIWRKDYDYFRIDGGVDSSERSDLIDRFNDPKEKRARLMLVSTRAGGIGINLIGANRAVIFDASFNPANDLQAIFRIYRLGQMKPVFIYRMIAYGTMEEKIYKKQILKQSLSRRVLDEQQVVRHYKKVEVEELYTLDADYEKFDDAVLPLSEKDDLLNDLIFDHKGMVLSLHEHDSLLEYSPEEELTEEERRVAWTEFENARIKERNAAAANAANRNGNPLGAGAQYKESDDDYEPEVFEVDGNTSATVVYDV